MLVFQSNFEHIILRCGRPKADWQWLVDLVAEINLHLPDDWRMTRSSNNFRIQVVGSRTPALVGRSFKTGKEEILHIVDTIFEKGYFDKFDLSAATGKKKGVVNASAKCEHPEIITPNLYFFRPCPDDSVSPLFARQYEKVKIDKQGNLVGDQFHRIHPLTRVGLDLEHFRWVRWDINGHIEAVESPDPEYRGRDYWAVPFLRETKKRGNRQEYLNEYNSILEGAEVKPYLPPVRTNNPYETEFKFILPDQKMGDDRPRHDALAAFDLIKDHVAGKPFAEATGFSLKSDSKVRAQEQTDLYFDDELWNLLTAGASFRLREKKGHARITLKKRFSASQKSGGLYERVEEEVAITAKQKKALIDGEPLNAFPYRLIAYVAPCCDNIKPKLWVNNRRTLLILEDQNHRMAELCLDEVVYKPHPGEDGVERRFFEIEIESRGAPRDSVRGLAEHLSKLISLVPSDHTKYERGVSLLYPQELALDQR